jgi:hypothetical protein
MDMSGQIHAPAVLSPQKKTGSHRRLSGPQIWYEGSGKKKIICHRRDSTPKPPSPQPTRCTLYVIPEGCKTQLNTIKTRNTKQIPSLKCQEQVHMEFVVDKVAVEHVFPRVGLLQVSFVSIFAPMVHTHSIIYYLRCIILENYSNVKNT